MVFSLDAALLALAGGAIIALATALLLLADGQIAGISGIAADCLPPWREGVGWRIAFLLGLLSGGLALRLTAPEHFFQATVPYGLGTAALAGLLVGLGTRMGNGCTSGHGICGMARGSGRSIVATLTFMGLAMLTVYLTRHLFAVL